MTSDEIRALQREEITAFLLSIEWAGRVLDFGCDIAPYRGIVQRGGGWWHGYNRVSFPSGHKREDVGPDEPLAEQWDMILCTQVLQYVAYPAELLRCFAAVADTLVLTYATNWPEVESEDLFRCTRSGMEQLLAATGWTVDRHEPLGTIPFGDREEIALGYGIVARS